MKKILFSLLCLLQGQNTYQGQVTFDYDGTEADADDPVHVIDD